MASRSENIAAQRPPRRELANAIRALAMDAVQAANSGHPGMPMGMADIAEVLWNDFLRFSPNHPEWPDRDRFVLSNGHGSMLQYALAYLSGYPLGIDEIEAFRQLDSRTAGHPEREIEIGIETTTGPLGQGLANAVGMALAEKVLASQFNRLGHEIVDHRTYVFLGDGCLMEGVSHEACSLAGTLKLGKLIAVYDDNGISIDGETDNWFTDDTPMRFRAYGWHVIEDVDGHDPDAVAAALAAAQQTADAPTLICTKTLIGFGSPNKQGTAATHGAALGADEVAAAREHLNWPHPPFVVPEPIRAAWDARERGAALEAEWRRRFEAYRGAFPDLAAEFERRIEGALPADWADAAAKVVGDIDGEAKSVASRKASEIALEGFGPLLPEFVGGSADLTGSNNTWFSLSKAITGDDASGNYIHYGVREFGMGAIMNGLALHGGLLPYGGTFLVFSDYARNSMRMAALMGLRTVYVLTHDSIGLGEDGPTHQPIEHLAGLRAIPNMHVWRPADTVETAVAWRAAVERGDGPTSLILSRQTLPHIERTADQIDAIARGGYIVSNTDEAPAIVLIATGSELGLAVEAAAALAGEGIAVRVVSMPCVEVFDQQDASYREHVLPAGTTRLVVEAGVADGWWRFVGGRGDVIGMTTFGQSAPAKELFARFGFTAAAVADAARRLV
ncbi:MAG: transketolase [Gammaproteobacteria bacterium]|nr:transketolase [Gammaproteobacteria bacterium]